MNVLNMKGALNNGSNQRGNEDNGQSWRKSRRLSNRSSQGAEVRTSSGGSDGSVGKVAYGKEAERESTRPLSSNVKDSVFEENRASNLRTMFDGVDAKIDKTTQRILRQYAANPSRADELSELRERIGRLNFMRSEFMAALAGVGDWIARNGGASLAHMLREGKENGLDYDLFMGSLAASTFPRETLGVCILPRLAMPETTTDTVPVRHVVTNAAQNNTNK